VSSGVILTTEEPVYTITGRYTVYVPLARENIAETYNEWRVALASIGRNLEGLPTNDTSFLLNYGARLVNRQYQRAVLNLRETFPLPSAEATPRVKRGLFNFVGDLASTLFGTPSASDMETLKEAQSALASTVDQVVETQGQTIAVVNTLNENQQRITDTLNKAVLQINILSTSIQDVRQEVTIKSMMDEIISEIISFRIELARYVSWSDKMSAIRAACESDSISEIVVPPPLLSVLIKREDVLPYYQYLHTDKMMRYNDTLYCVVNVPTFKIEPDQLYVVETYPICTIDSCHRLYHNEKMVINPLTETLYFPETCLGYHPLACRPSVEFPSATQPCLHGLINGDPQLQSQCPITVYRDHPLPLPGRMPGENRFAVATPDTTYRYLCPDQRPRTGTLTNGVYLITIDPGCAMDANLWRLSGRTHKTIYAAQPQSFPKPINITISIPATSLTLPSHLSVLEIDKVQKLQQPDSPHIKSSIFNLHARLTGNQDFWQWVILALIALIAALVVYRKYRAMLKCPTKFRQPSTPPPTYSQDSPIHYTANTSTARLYPDLPQQEPNAPANYHVNEAHQMIQTDPEDQNE